MSDLTPQEEMELGRIDDEYRRVTVDVARAVRDALRAQGWKDGGEVAALDARVRELEEALEGLLGCVDDIDPRLNYVYLQVDKPDLVRAQALVPANECAFHGCANPTPCPEHEANPALVPANEETDG